MQKTLFRFVKQVVSIARKLTDAALMQISDPAGNGVAGWKHAVLHFLRLHMEATLEEVLDWAEEMERVRAALVLERGEFPGPSALCKSFDRAPMRIWRELLRLSSELLNQSRHAAIDATYFDRRQASSHYLSRCNREVQTVQATFLVGLRSPVESTRGAAQNVEVLVQHVAIGRVHQLSTHLQTARESPPSGQAGIASLSDATAVSRHCQILLVLYRYTL